MSTQLIPYSDILNGKVIWEADGRGARPEHLSYRESFRATYQGPYTKGKLLAWDGLCSNRPGMIGNDPERGFDLTMHANESQAGSYTTRDLASAPHGVDYRVHYADWERDHCAHPNLMLPGRTALWSRVRFDLLNQGAELRGTAGAILQDWDGIDFDTMEKYGNTEKSQYSGGGFVAFNPKAMFPRIARLAAVFQKKGPFGKPIRAGVAPLYVMFASINGFLKTGVLNIDPGVPHDLASHWSSDAAEISYWLDGSCVLRVREGEAAIPTGAKTAGRVRLKKCAFHVDCWQDNGTGDPNVQGSEGHKDRDQVYTIEKLSILMG
jgi:hypothetical protein